MRSACYGLCRLFEPSCILARLQEACLILVASAPPMPCSFCYILLKLFHFLKLGFHKKTSDAHSHSLALVRCYLHCPAHFKVAVKTWQADLPVSAFQIIWFGTGNHVLPSASAYLALHAAFPALHSCALQLLPTLLWTAQAALLPQHASIAKLLANLLRQAAASGPLNPSPSAQQHRQQVTRPASACKVDCFVALARSDGNQAAYQPAAPGC